MGVEGAGGEGAGGGGTTLTDLFVSLTSVCTCMCALVAGGFGLVRFVCDFGVCSAANGTAMRRARVLRAVLTGFCALCALRMSNTNGLLLLVEDLRLSSSLLHYTTKGLEECARTERSSSSTQRMH